MDNTTLPTDGPFGRVSKWVARRAGHAASFAVALLIIVAWAVTGPIFGFSDTWQLVINTGTTIVTFLMVFLIQNSQTRDSEAMHIKLDELIESTKGARRELLDLEEMPEEELHRLQQGYEQLAAEARRKHHRGRASGRPTPGSKVADRAPRVGGPARKGRR
ncbi:MAG: low affinity iron permease family protein [Thermoplasmatota archaeon]